MKNTLKCPHCGKDIEVTDALTHQIEEQVLASLESKHKDEMEELRKKTEEDAVKKAGKNFESEMKILRDERDEAKERNSTLNKKLDSLLDEMKEMRRKADEREYELKKKHVEDEEKLKEEIRKRTEEEHQLKDMENAKKYSDALKQIEELKMKITQGSQQAQGEVLELSIESKLKLEFPLDKISEVKKGVRGADIIQEVIDKLGRSCGKILWESKNAQWSEPWILKLKEDLRQAKADIPVLVSVNLPSDVETFAYREGVWITSWKFFLPLAWTLRYNLVSVYHERQSNIGKDEKMQVLYQYITSKDFVHKIEAIVESYTALSLEIEKEKRFFYTKWARQEKDIKKVVENTHSMWGDFQSVIGKSLPEIKTLELDSGEEKDVPVK